jgi:hypothetical protein
MSIKKLQHRRLSQQQQQHTVFGFALMIRLVRPPSVPIEASCHRAYLNVASTSPLAHNSSDSIGTRVQSSCVGSHNDACGRADE